MAFMADKRSLSNFKPNLKSWILTENTLNLVENRSTAVFGSLSVNSLSMLDLWIIFRSNLKRWSSQRISHFLQICIISFAVYWDSLAGVFPFLTCVKLPFDEEDCRDAERILSYWSNEESDVSYLCSGIHVSPKVNSSLSSSLVPKDAKTCIQHTLIFIRDVSDYFAQNIYDFQRAFLDAVKSLKSSTDSKLINTLNAFFGVLGSLIPEMRPFASKEQSVSEFCLVLYCGRL